MRPLVTAAQMRELDSRTINELGLPGVVLMEHAGRGLADLIADRYGPVDGLAVAVLCGRGNNGGDGFVIGRWLARWGADVEFFVTADPDKITGDAKVNLDVALGLGLPLTVIETEAAVDELDLWLEEFDLIVDALLGTGLNSEVRGLYAGIIDVVNQLETPVAAVDLPSGLDSDTGRVWGRAMSADLTATFGLAKLGMAIHPGLDLCGHTEVIDIGLPERFLAEVDVKAFLTEAIDAADLLPRLAVDDHKGRAGHLLVLAGSPGKTGAAALTAEAAVRSGSGLVTVGCPVGINDILEIKLTEAMTSPLPQADGQTLGLTAQGGLTKLLDGKTALAVGPGLGTDEETGQLLAWLVEQTEQPMVIDADGLNLMAAQAEAGAWSQGELVLTPHPGEMARLLGASTADIQADRIGSARALAEKWGQVVVLKGARTVIASPEGTVFINPTGNPGLASGGSGDVLTGVIGGLLAQGLDCLEAAICGVYLHGLAADLLWSRTGGRGFTASEVAGAVPAAMAAVTEVEED